MDGLLILALALMAVLAQGMLGWRVTLFLIVPLVLIVVKRPITAAALVVVGGW